MALYPSVDPCCLRASSYCSQTDPSFAVTHSAIDPSKLISQRVRPARAPSRWPGNDRTEPESVDQLHHGSGRKAVFADRSDRILPVRRTPQSDTGSVRRLMGNAASAGGDRVAERHRAVALARHYRDFEGMSIRQIADRLGRSPATVKAYFYDPTGEKARSVKRRYQGVCRGCGAYTQPRNGKGDAYAHCKGCHPGAIELRWTRERVVAAMRQRRERYGRLPSSYDWSRTHAHRRGGDALERVANGEWPAASVVTRLFGSWDAARAAATAHDEAPRTP